MDYLYRWLLHNESVEYTESNRNLLRPFKKQKDESQRGMEKRHNDEENFQNVNVFHIEREHREASSELQMVTAH